MTPESSRASAKKPASAPETAGFDERLQRLEAIVGELENGGIALERAIERYQEGIGLLKSCRSTLDGYRKRVEELSGDAVEPYAADPDARTAGEA